MPLPYSITATMPRLTLFKVVVSSTPVFVQTLVSHVLPWTQVTNLVRSQANRELKFALSWALVKHFLELATHYSVESLQALTNTLSPAPIPAGIARRKVTVDVASTSRAAEVIVASLGGAAACQGTIGGSRWFQLRTENIAAEWIWAKRQVSSQEWDSSRVMFYINGGGYCKATLLCGRM